MKHAVVVIVLAGCGRLEFAPLDGFGDAAVGDGDAGGDAFVVDAGPPANRVFITSTTHVPGAIGSIAAADAICNTRAAAASLPGTYVAWLSSTTSNVRDRLGTARGWVRMDGLPFADTLGDLQVNRWFYPILHNELGVLQTGPIATASFIDGRLIGTDDCGGYTSTTGTVAGSSVYNGASYWTHGGGVACNMPAHLYCFGTSQTTPVAAPTVQGAARLAFVTAATWVPTTGISDADARCMAEANGMGLGSGQFRALLATTTASAISRFDTSGPPWVRPDRTKLVATAADLGVLPAPLLTSFSETPTGYLLGGQFAWLGASDVQAIGNVGTTCSDWSSTTGAGVVVSVSTYGLGLTGNGDTCASTWRLFCLEL